jgi:hypothetical protein
VCGLRRCGWYLFGRLGVHHQHKLRIATKTRFGAAGQVQPEPCSRRLLRPSSQQDTSGRSSTQHAEGGFRIQEGPGCPPAAPAAGPPWGCGGTAAAPPASAEELVWRRQICRAVAACRAPWALCRVRPRSSDAVRCPGRPWRPRSGRRCREACTAEPHLPHAAGPSL